MPLLEKLRLSALSGREMLERERMQKRVSDRARIFVRIFDKLLFVEGFELDLIQVQGETSLQ